MVYVITTLTIAGGILICFIALVVKHCLHRQMRVLPATVQIQNVDTTIQLDQLCTICTDDSLECIVMLSPCGHTYHNRCIMLWFNKQLEHSANYSCPLCRMINPIVRVRPPYDPNRR
jgi:hypothetical protein